MPTVVKLALSLGIILAATQVAKWQPNLAGLIAVMPLTGLIVLIWIYSEADKNPERVDQYVTGALFGALPSTLFFVAIFAGLKLGLSFWPALMAGAGVWLLGAACHQWLLG